MRPNLALVLCVYFVLYYISYIFLQMHVCFCCVRFSFSVLSQQICWEERFRILCRVRRKTSIDHSFCDLEIMLLCC